LPKDIYKTIQIDGETYSLRKFDAMTGLMVARLLLAKVAPLLPMLKDGGGLFEAIGTALGTLTDEEVAGLARKCLQCCSRLMPAGPQQLMDERGNYGVEGLEYDAPLVVKLCVEAVMWGATDFFGERASDLFRQ